VELLLSMPALSWLSLHHLIRSVCVLALDQARSPKGLHQLAAQEDR